MTTIGEAISRVRNTVKAVREDPFLTDRAIYYLIIKYGKTLLKREDNQNKLMKISSLFTFLPYMELIDIDKVEAGCTGVYSGCYFKRTKDRLPDVFTGMFGPIFRTVSSIDGTIKIFRTEPGTFVSMTKTTSFKYNTRKYFWFQDGYLYLPNVDWDAIRVEAIFEGDTGDFTCNTEQNCLIKQDQPLPLPEYLFSEIEQYVVQELTITMKIPSDSTDDSQNILR